MNTVESHNAGLTSRQIFTDPWVYPAMPTNPPVGSQSEQTATHKPRRERKRDLRIDAAREAMDMLKVEIDPEAKRELIRLIAQLTSGRKRKSPSKAGAFD